MKTLQKKTTFITYLIRSTMFSMIIISFSPLFLVTFNNNAGKLTFTYYLLPHKQHMCK